MEAIICRLKEWELFLLRSRYVHQQSLIHHEALTCTKAHIHCLAFAVLRIRGSRFAPNARSSSGQRYIYRSLRKG